MGKWAIYNWFVLFCAFRWFSLVFRARFCILVWSPAVTLNNLIDESLDPCRKDEDSLGVQSRIYELAQKVQTDNLCGKICSRVVYDHHLVYMSVNSLESELLTYGPGYFVLWPFYTSLHVKEAVETLLFDFDSVLVGIGSCLGLFLGWSFHSILMTMASLCLKKFPIQRKETLSPPVQVEPISPIT